MSSGVPEGNVTLTKEPEMGREPSGPDQSLPISATPSYHNSPSGSTSIVCFLRNFIVFHTFNTKSKIIVLL